MLLTRFQARMCLVIILCFYAFSAAWAMGEPDPEESPVERLASLHRLSSGEQPSSDEERAPSSSTLRNLT